MLSGLAEEFESILSGLPLDDLEEGVDQELPPEVDSVITSFLDKGDQKQEDLVSQAMGLADLSLSSSGPSTPRPPPQPPLPSSPPPSSPPLPPSIPPSSPPSTPRRRPRTTNPTRAPYKPRTMTPFSLSSSSISSNGSDEAERLEREIEKLENRLYTGKNSFREVIRIQDKITRLEEQLARLNQSTSRPRQNLGVGDHRTTTTTRTTTTVRKGRKPVVERSSRSVPAPLSSSPASPSRNSRSSSSSRSSNSRGSVVLVKMGIMSNVGRDITRGAVSELKRQVKSTARGLNPLNRLKKFKRVKRLFDAMQKDKGRQRGGRRPPPPFFRGSGRLIYKGGRRPPPFFRGSGRRTPAPTQTTTLAANMTRRRRKQRGGMSDYEKYETQKAIAYGRGRRIRQRGSGLGSVFAKLIPKLIKPLVGQTAKKLVKQGAKQGAKALAEGTVAAGAEYGMKKLLKGRGRQYKRRLLQPPGPRSDVKANAIRSP
ncbi:hypothetical protein AC249_AIPGENE5071 [Exaiptasia diaphana]|nr:hypothetical protein AC249_AIPGENE5071 [Exaiptasia diaphana]